MGDKEAKKNNIKVSMSHQKASLHLGIDLFWKDE